jgi:hypothetical protein
MRRTQFAFEDGVRKLQPMRRSLVTIPQSHSTREYMNRNLLFDYLTTYFKLHRSLSRENGMIEKLENM